MISAAIQSDMIRGVKLHAAVRPKLHSSNFGREVSLCTRRGAIFERVSRSSIAPSYGGPEDNRRTTMAESVYKVIELVGVSSESWEKAAVAAVERASKSLRDLRIAEVVDQDLQIENGKVKAFRAKVKVSFKFED